MPVTAEQFRAALEAQSNGAELLEFHQSLVNSEKDRGIQSRREANKEAQGLRKFKQAIEKMGFDPSADDADVDTFVQGIVAKMEADDTKSQGQLGELQKALTTLQKQFEKTNKELAAEKEQKTQLQHRTKVQTIESKLLPKLQEEFYGANFIVKALLADNLVDLDESGEVVFKKGDTVVPLADGLKSIAEQNADARKNKQQGGAGSSASAQPNRPKFTMEQIKSMTPEQVKTNLADVNASVRALAQTVK